MPLCRHVAVCCSVLQRVAVPTCKKMRAPLPQLPACVTVCCSLLQFVAVCNSALQCVAVCCSVL